MKKAISSVVLALCVTAACTAEPQYIILQKRWLSGWKLRHVEKPEKRLHKWSYDKANQTYYRVKTPMGIGVRAKVGNMTQHPEYVSVKQGWTAWKISSVDKPRKKLHKWYPDPQSGAHYRIRYYWGTSGKIW